MGRYGVKYYCALLIGFLVLLCLSVVSILYNVSHYYAKPWFVSTNVSRINACCQLEFNVKGYLFQMYEFSSNIKAKTTCYKYACTNISSDVIDSFGQMNNITKLRKGK